MRIAKLTLGGTNTIVALSVQTKNPGQKGVVPPPVAEFVEVYHTMMYESDVLLTDKSSDYIKVVHHKTKLWILVDLGLTVADGMISNQLNEMFGTWAKCSLDLQARVATAMTIKSIVDAVRFAHAGQPICQL